MDERLLTAFLTVAKTQNVSVAASKLNITQPALSRQLQKLQRELQVTLLQSHHSGVTLTAAGEDLLLVLQKVVYGILKAQADATMMDHGRNIDGTIGAPVSCLIACV